MISTARLIKDYLEELGIKQKEAASLMGYSEKQFSLVLNENVPVSKRFLSLLCEKVLTDFSVDYFLKYDAKYKKQIEELDDEFLGISYAELKERFHIEKIFRNSKMDRYERLRLLNESLGFGTFADYRPTLSFANRPAFLLDESRYGKVNQELLDIAFSVLETLYIRKVDYVLKYKGNERLGRLLTKYKVLLKKENYDEAIDAILRICEQAGINLILTRNIPSTYVRGAVYSKYGSVFMILSDRYKSLELFVFAFVHECEHLLLGDVSLDKDEVVLETEDDVSKNETLVNGETRRFFISDSDYLGLKNEQQISKDLLEEVAYKNRTTPGMIVSFLRHDKVIEYARFNSLMHPFELREDDERCIW